MRALLIAMVGLGMAGVAQAVDIDWVTVGDPGNACDEQPPNGPIPGGCFGSVDYTYEISMFETTSAQYAEFLNAVAGTDTYGLYNGGMESIGIERFGAPGSFTYSIGGDVPVNYVSFYDTLRFANWLHNGQPTGAQDATTTEDGAYTLNGYVGAINDDGSWIDRNPGATIFLTSEDEWYKAAYYDGVSDYLDYAAPISPYGTVDQGGNVFEWNEGIGSFSRGARGGGFGSYPDSPAASDRYLAYPVSEGAYFGFRVASVPVGSRVASVPEPTQGLLYACALATLALLRRRAHSSSSPGDHP